MNQPMFIQTIKSGTAANAPKMLFSRDTNTCVSRYVYWTRVNGIAANIAARYELLETEPDLFLIGYGINLALHDGLSIEDVDMFLG